ncbi:MAG: hypothetical protein U0570_13055 [Phycisphaerales bacterium]
MPFIPPKRRRAGARTRIARIFAFGVVALVGGELIARFGLGLGDPPLFVTDSKIEYLNKPGTYHRFGHDIHINSWSMRAPEIAEHKPKSDELRVLVIGDSVVFGGATLRDDEIATFELTRRLEQASGRKVLVANIAAGSWGPPNQLAYLERFGTFDADAMIVVWSSHDAWDVPTFAPLGVDNPTVSPGFALGELWTRYIAPKVFPVASVPPAQTLAEADQSLRAARSILELAIARKIPVAVVLHRTRSELGASSVEGLELLGAVAKSEGVPVFETATVFSAPKADAQFRDDIHPTAGGQQLLADLYFKAVTSLLNAPPLTEPTP